jgi:hypothetical protein
VTYGDIRIAIEHRLDDDPTSPVTYTAAEVLAAVNEGLGFFVLLTLCLEATATIAIVSTAGLYHVLSTLVDFLLPLKLSIAGTRLKPATLNQLNALDPLWRSRINTTTRYISKGFDLLGFFPRSNATVTVTYARSAAALAIDADVPEIPELYHPLLIDYGAYRILAPLGGSMLQRALPYFASFLAGAARVALLVRTRAIALRYDTLPPELDRKDISRVTTLRKDLAPARKEEPSWQSQQAA